MERLVNVNPNLAAPQTTIQYGYFVDDNLEAYFGKPLIFYPILQSGVGTTEISFRDSATTHSPLTSYFIPSNSLSLISGGYVGSSSKNINFYLEVNEYTLDTTFTRTLFEEHYLEYIQDIFNSKRRLTKLKAYLPLKIIYNLNMNDKVIINNQGYLINNLTTNLNTGESSMELLNDDTTVGLILKDVYLFGGASIDYYFKKSIGNAANLSVGDYIYTDSALTTKLATGTYYQNIGTGIEYHCDTNLYDCGMQMNINSSGKITLLFCNAC